MKRIAPIKKPSKSKYKNSRFTNEYGKWDSKGEFERYLFLLQKEKEGEICNLQRQVPFELIPKITIIQKKQLKTKVKEVEAVAQQAVVYYADFVYYKVCENGEKHRIIEDFKGNKEFLLSDFKLKMKIFYYVYRTHIHIVDFKSINIL